MSVKVSYEDGDAVLFLTLNVYGDDERATEKRVLKDLAPVLERAMHDLADLGFHWVHVVPDVRVSRV